MENLIYLSMAEGIHRVRRRQAKEGENGKKGVFFFPFLARSQPSVPCMRLSAQTSNTHLCDSFSISSSAGAQASLTQKMKLNMKSRCSPEITMGPTSQMALLR
ncbi:hypothetical protein AMELA_G00193460 [Ameiurus melas]|uniref:Uncharacterized protein n=1 Tax=Ameiurus melas TaxID=219545 RepID=A0A7J6A580_AMEME|nr:hypothetical protein AMELA_G00193460 [Ameiurus melas]